MCNETTKGLGINEYQEGAMTTCLPASANFAYMSLNLVGEVGEISSKVAKGIRKGFVAVDTEGNINPVEGREAEFETLRNELKFEIGDVMWQTVGLCKVLGFSAEEVANANLGKLSDRKKRNVIDGNGDHR